LLNPLCARLNGAIFLEEKQDTLVLKMEIPFSTSTQPPSSRRSDRRTMNLPSLTKYNLSNTRTSANVNTYIWSTQVIQPPLLAMYLP
jgi:hypothetical protein